MNNHNTNFYSIEEVERTLKSTKEFEDGEQLYYFIGALRYLYDNNKEKDKEIERLNNVINELEKYIKENSWYYNTSDGCQWVNQFKILDKLKELKRSKGEENEETN